MKRKIIIIAALFASVTMNAQIMTEKDFENYNIDKFDGKADGKADYVQAAINLKDSFGLDKNNQISCVSVVQCPDMSKEKIYVEANNWFANSFNDGKSVIQLNDKDAGTIIAKGFLHNIAKHVSFTTSADVSAWVIIRIDIKDGKFRMTSTIQEYNLISGQGVMGAMSSTGQDLRPETWLPAECFPFKGNTYKKTASKAYVACFVYSNILADKLTTAIKSGTTGVENQSW
jgi:hypothetical protein